MNPDFVFFKRPLIQLLREIISYSQFCATYVVGMIQVRPREVIIQFLPSLYDSSNDS